MRYTFRMALTKCRECGTEISSKAFVCPKCGHPAGTYRLMKRMFAFQAVIVIVMIIFIYSLIGWLS